MQNRRAPRNGEEEPVFLGFNNLKPVFNIKNNGGENTKVGEHSAVFIFELEAYPEPKILSSKELQELLKTHSYRNLAKALGCSIGFIYDRCSKSKSD
jgi:hypothetical protein